MSALQGTWPLTRLIVRRDRFRLMAWIAALFGLVWVTAASTRGLYSTQESLDAIAAASRDNPVAIAFNGPDLALDTLGGQVIFQMSSFGLLMIGLMSVLLLGRLTRTEEDSGRLELVRAMPVGRHAPLAAGVLVVVGTNVLVGGLIAGVLLAVDLPTAGSVAFGAACASFGLVFTGITAAAAQVSENPRVATGLAGGALGLSFVLRAVGDVGDGTLSWFSPMGWAQQVRAFAGERWWALGPGVVLGCGLIAGAVVLTSHRDFGGGLIAPSAGPARAAPGLRSPLGLAVRLHRSAVLWWVVGVLVLALVYGSLANSIEDFLGDNPTMEDVLAALGGGDITDSYLATSLLVISLMATGPGLQIAGRLRTEESEQRAEPLLATPVRRRSWLLSHVVVALAGSGLAVVAGGLGLGLAYGAVSGEPEQVPRLAASSLAYIPAVWLLVGVAVATFAFRPRWTAVAWVALAGSLVVAMFGAVLDVPTWVLDLSPFQHTPAVPAAPFRLLPVAALSVVAAVLVVLGTVRFRARDLVTN